MEKLPLCRLPVKEISSFVIIAIIFVVSFSACKKEDFSPGSLQSAAESLSKIVDHTNVILILGDDVGYEIPRCNGGKSYRTPNLDQMAATGTRFTQCHASPLCSPSRFMLLTGKYNFRNYAVWGMMDKNERTIADLLRDEGYKTFVGGKWQLDGGDQSIHSLGFDDYIVWLPFAKQGEELTGLRYKSPHLYTNGDFLADSLTLNKYGDDIVCDSIIQFMVRSGQSGQPFFVYYPMMLCHNPFSPTPDDREFATWDANLQVSDPKFFPSMVNYMDKKIGQIIHAVDSLGIAQNTIILYLGDNGSPALITSKFENVEIKGGKGHTTEYGTHVPLLVYEPGVVSTGVNDDLIDFTDFLPTIADMGGADISNNFGTTDGVSFYPVLFGEAGTPRSWIYCYYKPHENTVLKEWAQNINYKYYDGGKFYDIISDVLEENPISDSSLTLDEMVAKQQFIDVIDGMHK